MDFVNLTSDSDASASDEAVRYRGYHCDQCGRRPQPEVRRGGHHDDQGPYQHPWHVRAASSQRTQRQEVWVKVLRPK